ncbi:MAG TPA: NAD(P)H-binding protein [Vicinamibacterales bacterium]
MRFFLTGATGYIGSAVLEAGLRATHQVTALVRDPEKAQHVSSRGGTAVIGELSRPASYAAAAEKCDVLIHAASDRKRKQAVDREAIDTLMAAAERRVEQGLPACVIYTSGIWVLGHTQGAAKEDAPVDPPAHVSWRPEHEALVLEGSSSGRVRTAVIRPGIVYGGARGVIGDLLKDARNGLLRVVGDGRNHWPCIYDRDLADLYLRVAMSPDASGIFHVNDEADERVDDIVDSISRHVRTRIDIRHVPLSEARTKMGPYADALALDQIVRSPRARALGWSPTLHSVAGNVARLLEEFRTAVEAAA